MPRTISIPTKQDTAKITVAAALASLALLATIAATLLLTPIIPVSAQSSTTLVSNTGQANLSGGTLRDKDTPVSAQGFTTGNSSGGYLLESVAIEVNAVGDTDTIGDAITVTLNPSRDNGYPGPALCTFGNPATFSSSGVHTFTAPATGSACPTLKPETDYFVTVTLPYSDSTDTIHLSHNDVDNEDAGAADGWHIHDRSYSAHSAWSTHNEELQIQVRGEANAAPQGSIATNADTDTGNYLVTGGDTITLDGTTSDADGDAINHFWVSGVGGNFSHGWGQDTDWTAPPSRNEDYDAVLYLVATDEHGARTILTIQVTVTTGERPDPPTALRSAVSAVNHVSLSWTNNHDDDDIDSMALQQRVLGQWHTIRNLDNDATSVDLGQAPPSETLEFRLTIATSSGYRGYSDIISVKTLEGAPAPRHFAASTVTQTSVTLTWYTLETAAEYRLQYRKSGDAEWTRVNGNFDHLPSSTSHRPAYGTAAGLECNTDYDFLVSARPDGNPTVAGHTYPSAFFGVDAKTSATTGPCHQRARVTNLLVSIEPQCATITWTMPSGNGHHGYQVQRKTITDRQSLSADPETLVTSSDTATTSYQDCSAKYRTTGARHIYSVNVLDWQNSAYGAARTSALDYGPSAAAPEQPTNVRLTANTDSLRTLEWNTPNHPYLSALKTARTGLNGQQAVADPWITGYRVERREYRLHPTDGWYLPTQRLMLNAALTAAQNDEGSATGYQGGSDPRGTLDDATFAYRGSGYRIDSLNVSGSTLSLEIHPNVSADSYSRWNLKIGGETFALGDASNSPDADAATLTVQWDDAGLSWTNGQQVRVRIVEPLDWEPVQHESSLNTATSFDDVEERGSRNFVYRVKPNNAAGLTPYAFRGDWAFNDGDPGGEPNQDGDHTTIDDTAVEVAVPESETANSPATGAPTITGTPQVDQTLTASTSGIADPDGIENATFTYQWLRNNGTSDEEIGGATSSTYTAVSTDLGKTIKVRVDFTDDDNNSESLTSLATDAVTAAPNREATGAPTVSGTPQVDETLTADTSGISDQDGLSSVSYAYQWLAGGSEISGATGPSLTLTTAHQGETIQVRVDFEDDLDNSETLTSEATDTVAAKPDPLTASFSGVPESHLGSWFEFTLTFSENVKAGYERIRDDAFTISGGDITKAKRKVPGSNQTWTITVKPLGNGAISITLPATTDCDADGAIFTFDKRKLSHSTSVSISGPQ